MLKYNKIKVAIVGLGYVGLPLVLAFSKKRKILGFDIDSSKVILLKKGIDETKEVNLTKINKNITFSSNINDIKDCNVFIVTLPTPILKSKKPDLRPLIKCLTELSKILTINSLVIIESTVYPGVTEEIMSDVITKNTNLLYNEDFFMGYSPERINPGDKKRTVDKIDKLVAGSNELITKLMHKLYSEIVTTKVHKVDTIKIAEAAKVIENIQRDINIALVNELSIMFSKDNIDTYKVIKAASTKWNFHEYYPGLVGGHCIGIDPYYLTYWSKKKGYFPKMILSGRNINENMLNHTLSNILRVLKEKKMNLASIKMLVVGMAFKENCTDIRNSKSILLTRELAKKIKNIFVYDSYVKENSLQKELDLKNIKYLKSFKSKKFDCIIIATPHKNFTDIGYEGVTKYIIIDIKNSLKDKRVDFTL